MERTKIQTNREMIRTIQAQTRTSKAAESPHCETAAYKETTLKLQRFRAMAEALD